MDDLLAKGTRHLSGLLREAFEAGRRHERDAIVRGLTGTPPGGEPPAPRARRGSVRAALLRHLSAASEPEHARDVAAALSLNENSVRGKLNQLRTEGLVEKVGADWQLRAPP